MTIYMIIICSYEVNKNNSTNTNLLSHIHILVRVYACVSKYVNSKYTTYM